MCCPSIAQSWAQHTLRGNNATQQLAKQNCLGRLSPRRVSGCLESSDALVELDAREERCIESFGLTPLARSRRCKLTWLVLGGDPAARSHKVEQLTAL